MVPFKGHLSPLGQHTSPGSISLIAFLVQVKQNLCVNTEGHWTKSDPSRSPSQFKQWISSVKVGVGVMGVVSSGLGVLGSVLTASIVAAAASVLAIESADVSVLAIESADVSVLAIESAEVSPLEVRVAAVVRAEVWTAGTVGRVVAAEEVGENAESVFKFARLSCE